MPQPLIKPDTLIGDLIETRRRLLKRTVKQFAAKIAAERRSDTGTDSPKDESVLREIRRWGRVGATPPGPEWYGPIARGIEVDLSRIEAVCHPEISITTTWILSLGRFQTLNNTAPANSFVQMFFGY